MRVFLVGPANTTALGVILGVALGAGIPGLILLLVAAVALGLGCWLLGRSRGRGRQDWEIDFNELEMGDILGSGGYGEVYRVTLLCASVMSWQL